MYLKREINQKQAKLNIKKYSGSSKYLIKLTNPLPIALIIVIIAISIIFAFSFESNSSAIPTEIPTVSNSNQIKQIQSNLTTADTAPIPEFPLCRKVQPTLDGSSAMDCEFGLGSSTKFEFFDSPEALETLVTQYGLEEIPKNPNISIRVGQFQGKNRLLVADPQNLRSIDIQSDYSQEILLDWLKILEIKEIPDQPLLPE